MKSLLTAQSLREMRNIFILAAILGVAYNFTSPLGVNVSGVSGLGPPSETPAVPPSSPVTTLRSLANPSLHNQTITAVVIPMAAGSGAPPASPPAKLPIAMAWAEVKPLLMRGQVTLVDARNKSSYDAGHIPGAISLPLDSLKQQFPQFSAQYPKDKPVVVYCESVHCSMAHEEAVELADQDGFHDVREMPGGIAEWRVAGSSAPVVSLQSH
jgi:rhodanese-related sulfurtransferase